MKKNRFPQTEEEQQQHIKRVTESYVRALKAERRRPMDQMGPRALAIVWWDLEVIPAVERTGAALWEHRMFALAFAGLVVTALKLFWH